jgi:hypothetical protein
MPPEQLMGRYAGVLSDIYSLGATLYVFFTGQYAHRGLIQSLQQRPDEPRKIRLEIPDRLSALLMHMLATDPKDRPAGMAEVVAELEALAQAMPAGAWRGFGELAPPSAETEAERINLTRVAERSAPPGFFDTSAFPRTQFFSGDQDRYAKIQDTLQFYRDHLSREYASLWRQANLTYYLWIGCVGFGFAILLAGIITLLAGYTQQGVVTTLSTTIVFFLQRVFHQREDHYRALAAAKNTHLEYGNQWLLIIQSIDSMQDPAARAKRQERLVDALTKKLGTQLKTM